MEDRIKIIDSFKSYFGKIDKGIDQRIKLLKVAIPIVLLLVCITAGFVLGMIMLDLMGVNALEGKWNNAALSVLLSISVVLYTPSSIYEIRLLTHSKRLRSSREFVVSEAINTRLRQIIDGVNRPKYRWFLIALATPIMISSLWHLLGGVANPVWEHTKILIVVFYGIVLINFIKNNRAINVNIKRAEQHIGL